MTQRNQFERVTGGRVAWVGNNAAVAMPTIRLCICVAMASPG